MHAAMTDLPEPVAELAMALTAMPCAVVVKLNARGFCLSISAFAKTPRTHQAGDAVLGFRRTRWVDRVSK